MFLCEQTTNGEVTGCFRAKEEGWFEHKTVIWTDFLYTSEKMGVYVENQIETIIFVADQAKKSVEIQ